MKILSPSLSISLACFVSLGYGYALASDCTGDVRDFIKWAADVAIARMELAGNEMEKIMNNNNPNEEVKKVAQYLFKDTDYPEVWSALLGMALVKEDLGDIPHKQVPSDNVLIYCTQGTKYQEYGADKKWTNTEFLVPADKQLLEECFNGKGNKYGRARAFTNASPSDAKFPSLVQMCPWDYEQWYELKGKESVDYVAAAKRMKDEMKQRELLPVDLLADLVHSLIHEFAHTQPGGYAVHAGGKETDPDSGTEVDVEAYGWVNCVRLKEGLNADSIAFFASAVHIIINSGQRPTEAGDIEPVPNWSPPAVAKLMARELESLPARLNFGNRIARSNLGSHIR